MNADLIWSNDTYAANQTRHEEREDGLALARIAGLAIRKQRYCAKGHIPFAGHRTCAEWSA